MKTHDRLIYTLIVITVLVGAGMIAYVVHAYP